MLRRLRSKMVFTGEQQEFVVKSEFGTGCNYTSV